MDAKDQRTPPGNFTLVLVGIFAAAVAITLFIGLRGDSSSPETTETSSAEIPDLGDIATNDPDVPGDEEAAPAFAVATFDGSDFDLGSHLETDGRPVILNLWASWCGPCRAEMPAINTAAEVHPEVKFIGVAVQDDEDDARGFAEEIGITYALAFDDGAVDDAYPVLGLPATFFINADGTIAKRHFGVVTVESLDEDIATLFGS